MNTKRRPSLLGPVLLIGLGILLLLQNLGLLPFGFWSTLWRLWPVLLVIGGLDLILGRRSALGSLIALALGVVLIGGALVWAFRVMPGSAVGASTVRQPLGAVEQARVLIDFGAGQLIVEPGAGEDNLVDGTVTAASEEFSVEDGQARLEIRHDPAGYLNLPFINGAENARWEIRLTGEVPLDLSVDAGVGETAVDLTGLQVSSFDLDAGIGQARVIFPDEGQVEAGLSGGIGELVVTIPPGLPARLTVSTGIGNFQAPSNYVRRGDVYETPGFSTDGDYLDATISIGIGSIIVR